ncbi:MAG TPA: PP2C family serine/threonine-protein phosphatase [Myxococcota bacterium]|jgi:protein phosphatase|nr:PP2C family serine/threonine-protein phosphatase [Myxococcota bacterium]
MRVRSCGLSDVGRKRKRNEDAFLLDDGLGLYIVADGMGGHAKGEVASAEAVENIHAYVSSQRQHLAAYVGDPGNDEMRWSARRLIEAAVQNACYLVFGMAEVAPEHRGMGTTISAMVIAGPSSFIAQVGDSRVYRVRAGRADQVTEDHTLVREHVKAGLLTEEQAKVAPYQNVITRAVGNRDWVEVDTIVAPLEAGDRYLLCSDGLHGYLDTDEIPGVIGTAPLEQATEALVKLANSRGGRDNITAVVLEVL